MADKTVVINQAGPKKEADNSLAGAAVITSGLESLSGVITELIRAGQSSPLLSAVTGLVTGDVLQRLGVISETTNLEIRIMILTATGTSIAADLAKGIEGAVPFSSSGSGNTSLLQPSGQVFVYGNAGENAQLNALLLKLASAKS